MPNSSITDRLSSLPNLRKTALFKLWQQLFKTDPPNGLRKELMVQFLGYRMQEEEFGGLANRSHTRLRELSKALEGNSDNPFQTGNRSSREPGSSDSGKSKSTL
jgi:Protein of unknown function (DUF2924)